MSRVIGVDIADSHDFVAFVVKSTNPNPKMTFYCCVCCKPWQDMAPIYTMGRPGDLRVCIDVLCWRMSRWILKFTLNKRHE